MSHNIYIYILVMAAVTYLIRMLPLALAKNEIRRICRLLHCRFSYSIRIISQCRINFLPNARTCI